MGKEHLLPIVFALVPVFCCFASETASASEPGAGLEGVISLGPIHGGPIRLGESDSKPLANTAFLVKKNDVELVSFTTDDQGRFRISLPPGHYTVSKKNGKGRFGNYGPFEVDIATGEMKQVEWKCDTGMR